MPKKSTPATIITIARYLAQRWYYILMATAVWLGLLLLGASCYLALPSMICLAYFARTCDDYFDFKKDRGKRLSKNLLLETSLGLACIFLILEVLQYRVFGLFSIIPLAYVWFMNRYRILKLFVLPVVFSYFSLIAGMSFIEAWPIILCSLVLNIILVVCKPEKAHA